MEYIGHFYSNEEFLSGKRLYAATWAGLANEQYLPVYAAFPSFMEILCLRCRMTAMQERIFNKHTDSFEGSPFLYK